MSEHERTMRATEDCLPWPRTHMVSPSSLVTYISYYYYYYYYYDYFQPLLRHSPPTSYVTDWLAFSAIGDLEELCLSIVHHGCDS